MNLSVSVEKSYPGFKFSADFRLEGNQFGVFGPSGSGKSTLMHMLAGLLRPDTGRIRLDDTTLFDSNIGINVPAEKRRIGVVFQHAHLFPHMDVQKNLLYGWQRTKADERLISPQALIEVLNLSHLLDRGASSLSGGERQRVALGRAVLACPRLILMDEPLTGLDEELKFQIIPYLKRVFDEFGIPLVFISHSLREMRLMTDEVLVFREGGLKDRVATEDLARHSLTAGSRGYANILILERPQPVNDLWGFAWGETELILTDPGGGGTTRFELDAKDIMLFKKHPEASSARNLLPCEVIDLFQVNNRVGVELDCRGNRLIAQIVSQSIDELDIRPGVNIVAAIKASAFRPLF
jgi:molybdate transport system ATP-binding protein